MYNAAPGTTFPTATRPVPACFSDGYQFFYEIQSGDTFNKIIDDWYGPTFGEVKNAITQKIKKDNPDIIDTNLIYVGNLLYLEIPFRNEVRGLTLERSEAIHSIKQGLGTLSHQEKEIMSSLETSNAFKLINGSLTFTSGCLSGFQKNLISMNPAINKLIHNYSSYAKGEMSKHFYNKARKEIISSIQHKSLYRAGQFKLSPSQGKAARKILASAPRTKGLGLFAKEIEAGAKFTKIAKWGGIAANVIEISTTGYQAYTTNNPIERNELIAGQAGSTVGGFLGYTGGMALTAFLVGTPTGWVAIFIGGSATLIGSIAFETLAKASYSKICKHGKPFFIEQLNSEWVCP
jgi:hypothetical protein